MAARNGSAGWRGDIKNGSGTVTVGNGVFPGAYSYGARFGEGAGTNPEQLIAGAQAACFTMALAALPGAVGHVPESLPTNALVHLRNVAGSPTLARLDIDTEGHVPGFAEQQFQRYAEEAKANCPVARAARRDPQDCLNGQAGGSCVMNFDVAVLGGRRGGYMMLVSVGRAPLVQGFGLERTWRRTSRLVRLSRKPAWLHSAGRSIFPIERDPS